MADSVAYTAGGWQFPPYINVTKLDDGQVRVTVRSGPNEDGSCGSSGCIVISEEQWRSIADWRGGRVDV